jgi:hypothetical protein
LVAISRIRGKYRVGMLAEVFRHPRSIPGGRLLTFAEDIR